ncbi:MAG: F0F1 ATP synthase subunit B [Acidimicrobiia bacterium]|nr:F0F1 ATP synthase subunit B [Acidimicrobiia bacterium]
MRRFRLLAAASALVAVAVLGPAGTAFAEPKGHAEEECIEILEGGGEIDECQEAPSPIAPEVNEIIWGGLFFLIVAGVLIKFAFPALRQGLKAREDRIRGDLEEAEHAKTEAERTLEEYRGQLASARDEAGRIIEEARQAADQVRADLVSRAEAEAAELRARAQEDIRLATERATADLRQQVTDLAIDLAERVVERNLDRDTQVALVESFIDQVGGRPA